MYMKLHEIQNTWIKNVVYLEVENIINYKYEVAFHWCAHVEGRFKNTNFILFIS